MKRKLIWLNIALAGLIVAASYRVGSEWSAQKQREQAIRAVHIKPVAVKPAAVPPTPAAVTAGAYSEIATKMLFSQERNPTVVVEVPPPPKPKPVPPLPLLQGVMGMPDGMLALMSVKANTRAVGVKVGDKIGDFELASLSRDEISFKWEDKTITKSVSEMIYHAQEQAATAAPPPQQAAAASPAGATPAQPPSPGGKVGAQVIGLEAEFKTCTPGDTSPSGTISDGYKKFLVPTPFGNSCHWELVK